MSTDKLMKSLLDTRKLIGESDTVPDPLLKPNVEFTKGVLKQCFERFNQKCEIKSGMIVEWKPGLKNKKRPRYGEPAIVLEVLEKPVRDTIENAGSAYFNEPLDVIVGIMQDDGDFAIYYFDSRRFRPLESGSNL